MMRVSVTQALDPAISGRDVLSALAAAWFSSSGAPVAAPVVARSRVAPAAVAPAAVAPAAAAAPALPVRSALPVRFNTMRRVTAVDQTGTVSTMVRRRVAGR